ncbi:MAG: IS110 family transposase [Sphingobacteriales bacterium]
MDKKTKAKQSLQLAVINPNCAAIDIGSMMMMVSYSDIEGNQYLLEVDAFTGDLEKLAQTLKTAGVNSVAMEATGVYWMALYEILESYGFKVSLVNPKHFKNVDAQKTDVKDSQWLHQLHAHGLLRASHIAPEVFRELKSYLHERMILQNQKSDTLNRIHRTLTQMNIKVQHLISDIEGVAGMKILRGIAGGINDPETLLSVVNIKSLKADREDLLKSLTGIYKGQYVFILQNLLKAYDFYKAQMKEYELLIEDILKRLLPNDNNGKQLKINPKKGLVRKNEYSINIKDYLKHIIGVDVTEIDGLDEISALEIISVTGMDMNKWPTAEHFASWLNLSPRFRKTGGKMIGYDKRFTNNNATQAFRLAAQTMWQNKGALGHLYRRLAAQKGSKKAVKAVARKLAVIFYNVVKSKTPFDKSRLKADTEKQQAKKIRFLQREAAKYGYELQPNAA